jgi:hypothetical protein
VLVRHRKLIFVAKILWRTTHAPQNAYFGAPQKRFSLLVIPHLHFIGSSSSRMFAKNCFTKLPPIHELGKFQRHILNFTALSTGDAEEGENLGRRRRRSIMRSSARTWSSSRYLGLVFTPHRAARAPFHRYGRRGHRRGVFRFVLTAARAAAVSFLHLHTSVQVCTASIFHWGNVLGGKTLDEMWEKKTMRRRKLVMKGLGFFPSQSALFISNLSWATAS